MNPEEILPALEKKNTPRGSESTDSSHENDGARSVEQKPQAAKDGSSVMSAAAVDDAQKQVQGIPQTNQTVTSDDDDLGVPDVAEDVDLIEKEWVKKAKDIVNATYGDPYTQNKQMNKMKIEYIKKRYDRVIKERDE